MTEKDIERFWSFVDMGEPDACWHWKGTVSRTDGFGRFGMVKAKLKPHRVAYQITYPKPELGREKVVQACGNKLCCNPNHILVAKEMITAGGRKLPVDFLNLWKRMPESAGGVDPRRIWLLTKQGFYRDDLQRRIGISRPNVTEVLSQFTPDVVDQARRDGRRNRAQIQNEIK